MGRYNLLDEKWIEVIADYSGQKEKISLVELFENAHKYLAISGDMKIQDFALMRLLLAVLHTVFSRYDADGRAYEEVEVNEKMGQLDLVHEEDYEDYEDELMETWKALWNRGSFPDIVVKYLETWRDSFYLYGENPFYQVSEDLMSLDLIKQKNIGSIAGKNVNRTLTESNNKVALFASKYEKENNKELLNNDEIARWLITFQAYTGLADKTTYGKEKYKTRNSKGWLYDLGGLYLGAENIFESLMLNLVLVSTKDKDFTFNIQKPAWEFDSKEIIDDVLSYKPVTNIAQLYTNYSRAVRIDPDHEEDEPFSMRIIKLPEVDHEDQFLEPMTIYRYNKTGNSKGKFTPRKHQLDKALWRSFGLLTRDYDANDRPDQMKPGIIEWLQRIEGYVDLDKVSIVALSLEDDGNATSWVPTNEIYDSMPINLHVISDIKEDGWVNRINHMVDFTKEIVDLVYGGFIRDINEIRNIKSSDYVNKYIENMYFVIDRYFKELLEDIRPGDSKDETEAFWLNKLKGLVRKEVEDIFKESNKRDYSLVEKGKSGQEMNIAIAYNIFAARLNKY